ncbi:MAG: DNA polymerase III subunit delta' [Candidatus Aerophobetes bacterium]|nr:DNA polymerase III subunit delta' [Candidatus Aerophobetes bacterium]
MSFQRIIGQHQAIKILQEEIVASSISGAYLFAGPDGVGKTLTALTFAKTLNCKKGGIDSCDNCSSCRKIDHLNHPDVHIITPDGDHIKIEQIRSLKKEIVYRAYEGKKKIWIIQEADKLTLEASNSLLKTLEEPPSDSVLILISQSREKLLPTILSRCEIIRFLPLSSREIESLISKYLPPGSPKLPLIVKLARGKVGEALRLTKEEKLLRERGDILNQLSRNLSVEEIFNTASEWKNYDTEKLENILDILLFWFHDLLILKLNERENKWLINLDRIPQLKEQKKIYSFRAIKRAIETIEKTKNYLNTNVNRRTTLEVMGLKLREYRNSNH